MAVQAVKLVSDCPAVGSKPTARSKAAASDRGHGFELTSRRRAREVVLQILYQCDTMADWRSEQVAHFFKHFLPHYSIDRAAQVSRPLATQPAAGRLVLITPRVGSEQDNVAFAVTIAQGVLANLVFIDQQIKAAATNWSLDRMARVDRNVLRLATYEIAFFEEVPVSVSINEAIEIVRHFSAPESCSFVNGVLDRIATNFVTHPEILEAAKQQPSLDEAANV